MKPYPSYKDSGVKWIDEIPSTWETSKIKYLCKSNELKLSGQINPHTLFKYVEIGDVKDQKIKSFLHDKFENIPVSGRRILRKNDIIVSCVRTYLKSISIIKENIDNLICSTGFCVLSEGEKINQGFLYYFILTDGFISKVMNNSSGVTYPTITSDKLINLTVCVPIRNEQQQIVSFLDNKTSLIDSIIEKTRRKIELLKEKRTSLINEVVTKGLNPNVEMKDSGVEWIGEIPSCWKTVPLRYLGSFQNGISKGSEYFGKGYPFMNYGDVYKNEVTPTKVEGKVESDDVERERYSVLRRDIFFTRTSESKDDIGVSSTCLETIDDCSFSGFVIRYRFNENTHLPEYSRYHFQTHWKKVLIESKMNIVTRSSLSQQVLGQVPVLIPDLDEQQQIVEFLDEQTGLIDKTISIEEKRIELLKEYRQSLISEVVTGKTKVID